MNVQEASKNGLKKRLLEAEEGVVDDTVDAPPDPGPLEQDEESLPPFPGPGGLSLAVPDPGPMEEDEEESLPPLPGPSVDPDPVPPAKDEDTFPKSN